MRPIIKFIFERKPFFIILLLFCFFILLGRLFEIQNYVNAESIKQILALNWYISLPLFIALCCLANLTNSPTTVILTAVVYVVGRSAAVPFIFVGSVTSCVFTFLTISFFTKNAAPEIKNSFAKKWLARLKTQPILAIFILRFLLQFSPILNYTLALSQVSFKDYFIGTFCGMILPSFFLSYVYEFLVKAGSFVF